MTETRIYGRIRLVLTEKIKYELERIYKKMIKTLED